MPKTARTELKIIPISHMDQVIDLAMAPEPTIEPPRPRKRNDDRSVEDPSTDNSPDDPRLDE